MRFVSLVLHIYFLHMGEQIESWKPSQILQHILTHRYIAAAAASFDGRITLLCEFYIYFGIFVAFGTEKYVYIFQYQMLLPGMKWLWCSVQTLQK